MKKNSDSQDPQEQLNSRADIQFAFRRCIQPNFLHFASGIAEAHVLLFILDKTLRFGKYSELLKPADFKTGTPEALISGVSQVSDRHLREVRSMLRDRGLVFVTPTSKDRSAPSLYTPNFFGVTRAILKAHHPAQAIITDWDRLAKIFKNSKTDFQNMGLPYDTPIMIQQNRFDAISEDAREMVKKSKVVLKRYLSTAGAKPLTVNMISPWMKECCVDFEIDFYESSWTGKEYQSAKNFLKYCAKSDRDPRAVLRSVCQFWGRFRIGELTYEGRPVVLPENRQLSKFFIYRREIEAWIAVNRNRKTILSRFKLERRKNVIPFSK